VATLGVTIIPKEEHVRTTAGGTDNQGYRYSASLRLCPIKRGVRWLPTQTEIVHALGSTGRNLKEFLLLFPKKNLFRKEIPTWMHRPQKKRNPTMGNGLLRLLTTRGDEGKGIVIGCRRGRALGRRDETYSKAWRNAKAGFREAIPLESAEINLRPRETKVEPPRVLRPIRSKVSHRGERVRPQGSSVILLPGEKEPLGQVVWSTQPRDPVRGPGLC